jgi:anthranilate/para-aminobenzoate synthase component II
MADVIPPLREGSRGGTYAFPLRGENRTGESVPHACRGNLKEGVQSISADSVPPADTHLQEGNSSLITAYCDYGVRFACAIGVGNLYAVQFHPEKSSDTGLQILRNFLAVVGVAPCRP